MYEELTKSVSAVNTASGDQGVRFITILQDLLSYFEKSILSDTDRFSSIDPNFDSDPANLFERTLLPLTTEETKTHTAGSLNDTADTFFASSPIHSEICSVIKDLNGLRLDLIHVSPFEEAWRDVSPSFLSRIDELKKRLSYIQQQ